MSNLYPLVAIGKLCAVFEVSRQAWYKSLKDAEERDFQESILLHEVQKIRHRLPGIGVEKVHFMLQKQGTFEHWSIKMGRDKLSEMLNRFGVKPYYPKRGRSTTNSKHSFRIHKNCVKNMQVERKNQVWVSDITYVPVGQIL
jgi:putative transposase